MRRISNNSSDDAMRLADAGNASLALGDANAALNFFTRANAIRPNNGRIVAGSGHCDGAAPKTRLRRCAFLMMPSGWARASAIAADRALAFDLLGNFARAQQDYQLARTAATSDDIIIRQAMSLNVAGRAERNEADAMLVPLLQKNSADCMARAGLYAGRAR